MGFGTTLRSTTSVCRWRRPPSSAVLRPKTPPPTTMRSKLRPVTVWPVWLRVQPADLVGVGHAADAFHERGGAQVHVVFLRGIPHPCERAGHDLLQAGDDLALLPEVELEPLDPLEVGDDDAARVGEDIGDDDDAAAPENRVGFGCGWAVRALDDDLRADLVGVVLADLGARGRGHQDVAGLLEEIVVGDRVGALEAHDAAGLLDVFVQRADVEALAVPDAAPEVADA